MRWRKNWSAVTKGLAAWGQDRRKSRRNDALLSPAVDPETEVVRPPLLEFLGVVGGGRFATGRRSHAKATCDELLNLRGRLAITACHVFTGCDGAATGFGAVKNVGFCRRDPGNSSRGGRVDHNRNNDAPRVRSQERISGLNDPGQALLDFFQRLGTQASVGPPRASGKEPSHSFWSRSFPGAAAACSASCSMVIRNCSSTRGK